MKEKIDVEARVEVARNLFKSGYNCSQSVFMAYADIYGIDKQFAARLTGPLGGGMGRLREVCGAVSGAFLVIGQEFSAENPDDREAKTQNYAVVQDYQNPVKKRLAQLFVATSWAWRQTLKIHMCHLNVRQNITNVAPVLNM